MLKDLLKLRLMNLDLIVGRLSFVEGDYGLQVYEAATKALALSSSVLTKQMDWIFDD